MAAGCMLQSGRGLLRVRASEKLRHKMGPILSADKDWMLGDFHEEAGLNGHASKRLTI